MKNKLFKLRVRMPFVWTSGKKSVKGDIIECYVLSYRPKNIPIEMFHIKSPDNDTAMVQCRRVKFYEAEIEPQTDNNPQ